MAHPYPLRWASEQRFCFVFFFCSSFSIFPFHSGLEHTTFRQTRLTIFGSVALCCRCKNDYAHRCVCLCVHMHRNCSCNSEKQSKRKKNPRHARSNCLLRWSVKTGGSMSIILTARPGCMTSVDGCYCCCCCCCGKRTLSLARAAVHFLDCAPFIRLAATWHSAGV